MSHSPVLGRLVVFGLGLSALAVSVCVATLLTLALLPLPLPGWTTTAVLSDSMGPVIRAGDAVVVREDIPVGDLSAPTVVLVERAGQEPLLHRIVERRPDGRYLTRGDANAEADSTPVAPEQVKGAGRLVVPWVGTPATWVRKGRVLELLALAVVGTGLVLLSRCALDARYDPWVTPAPAAGPPGGRPSRRRRKALAVGTTALVAVTALQGDSPLMAHAAFSDAAEYGGQHFAADGLQPPTALTAAVRCVPAETAPTVVGSSIASGTHDITIAMPSQVAAGDLLLAQVSDKDDSLSGPARWTRLKETVYDGKLKTQIWQRIATGTDSGASYTWPSGGSKGAIGVLAVRGSSGLVATGDVSGSTGDDDTATAPSRTVSVANSLLVTLYSAKKKLISFGTPTGMSVQYNYGTDDGIETEDSGVGAFTEARPTIGATLSRTSILSKSTESIGMSLLVRPVSLPKVELTWTATPSTYATGHEVLRGAVSQATLTPSSITTWTDENPGPGARAYQVRARFGNWLSTTVDTASLTPGC